MSVMPSLVYLAVDVNQMVVAFAQKHTAVRFQVFDKVAPLHPVTLGGKLEGFTQNVNIEECLFSEEAVGLQNERHSLLQVRFRLSKCAAHLPLATPRQNRYNLRQLFEKPQ